MIDTPTTRTAPIIPMPTSPLVSPEIRELCQAVNDLLAVVQRREEQVHDIVSELTEIRDSLRSSIAGGD